MTKTNNYDPKHERKPAKLLAPLGHALPDREKPNFDEGTK